MNNLKDFIKGFKTGQKLFGETISAIVNFILLTVVYVIGVGITSLFAKLLNNHFLELKPSVIKQSYWSDLNLNKKPMVEYFRQF